MNSFHDPRSSMDPAMSYIYGDTEQYLSTTSSESQSPLSSSFDMQLYIPDFSAADVYPSPDRETASPDTPTEAPAKTPAKRKRENRYKNAPPSVLSRRRAQNRASQRAYRERKDQRIKDLEQMLGEAKQRNETLTQAYAQLQAEYGKLKSTQYQDQPYAEMPFDPRAAAAAAAAAVQAQAPVGLDLDLFTYPNMTANYQM